MGAQNVVVTGGHLERAIDLLSIALPEGNFEQLEFASDRLRSTSVHGTGCAFATALAANLAQGRQLQYAIVLAKAYVTKAISRAFPRGQRPWTASPPLPHGRTAAAHAGCHRPHAPQQPRRGGVIASGAWVI